MLVEDIKIVGGHLAFVQATIDGVACDAEFERDEPVVRTTRGLVVVVRGTAVPTAIVEAITKARELARSYSTGVAPRAPIMVVHPDLLATDEP